MAFLVVSSKVPVREVGKYEVGLLRELRSGGKAILAKIAKEQKLTDEIETELKEFIGHYTKNFS